MKTKYSLLPLFLLLVACDSTEEIATETTTSSNAILLRTESQIEAKDGLGETRFETEIVSFSYDTENRVSLIDPVYTQAEAPSYTVEYDENRLTRYGDTEVTYEPGKIIVTSANLRLEYFIEESRITGLEQYQLNNQTFNFELVETSIFTYGDDSKNIIKAERFNPQDELIRFANFEYDDKKNPYESFEDVLNFDLLLPLSNMSQPSTNNCVKVELFFVRNNVTDAPIISTATYTYNALGYPESAEINLGEGLTLIDKTFIYESE